MALPKNRDTDRITVIGAGTSGYLTVLYLCTKFPNKHITWIYPEINQPIGVGEASVPEVQEFLNTLGICLDDVIRNCNGNFKIGVKFVDWWKKGHTFYHPFGLTDTESLELEYMMQNNRIPDNLLTDYHDLASHFDVKLLTAYLDQHFTKFNNLTIERKFVNSLEEVVDTVVVDCTGFNKSFINQIDPNNFVSITDIIPNNQVFVYRADYLDKSVQQVPYTTMIAQDYGWIWNIPLADKITYGYVHNSKYDVRQSFIDYVETQVGPIDASKVNTVAMTTGRNKNHILHTDNKTVCSVGLSSCFIEPLEATGLYLTIFGIRLLGQYIEHELTDNVYNETYNNEFDAVLDFVVAHYKYSERDNEYWRHYNNLDIALYKSNGIFPARSWDYIIAGFKDTPRELKIKAESILKLRKGLPFNEWMKNAGYST
jgi:tryptophan halogenase